MASTGNTGKASTISWRKLEWLFENPNIVTYQFVLYVKLMPTFTTENRICFCYPILLRLVEHVFSEWYAIKDGIFSLTTDVTQQSNNDVFYLIFICLLRNRQRIQMMSLDEPWLVHIVLTFYFASGVKLKSNNDKWITSSFSIKPELL